MLREDQRRDARNMGRGLACSGSEEVAGVVRCECSWTEAKIEDEAWNNYGRNQAQIVAGERRVSAWTCKIDDCLPEIGIGSKSGEVRGAQRKADGCRRRDGEDPGRLGRDRHERLRLVEIQRLVA